MSAKRYDPIQFENCFAPVLLMHGDSDTTVSINGQKDYYLYLTENRKREDVNFLIYQNTNHIISPEMVKDLLDWLNKKLEV
ncbi:alpha/beta hydrolase family protein [Chengkuizengella sp. SCS-71B]|uniref:alpha/beta hydrolase family protein n=1 Tax=Chengkuizengella sp. SCS-71B TaxID=3115290 RepID=UPI0032C23B67